MVLKPEILFPSSHFAAVRWTFHAGQSVTGNPRGTISLQNYSYLQHLKTKTNHPVVKCDER